MFILRSQHLTMCCLGIIRLIANVAVTAASYVYLSPTYCYYTLLLLMIMLSLFIPLFLLKTMPGLDLPQVIS